MTQVNTQTKWQVIKSSRKDSSAYFCTGDCGQWYGLILFNLEKKMCLECSGKVVKNDEKNKNKI